eukprot:COSAG01_NODE_56441_length_318_cov_1.000000_1_plen_22_part_10
MGSIQTDFFEIVEISVVAGALK